MKSGKINKNKFINYIKTIDNQCFIMYYILFENNTYIFDQIAIHKEDSNDYNWINKCDKIQNKSNFYAWINSSLGKEFCNKNNEIIRKQFFNYLYH